MQSPGSSTSTSSTTSGLGASGASGMPGTSGSAGTGATASASTSTGRQGASGQREQFSAEELTIVMSHYDVGVIDSVVEFPRGSRKAPKILIVSEQGKFLLKRRARGKDDPYKVAFCHALQLYLASKQFPLPHLIGTRKENNSMLQWRNAVYELFEYIPGQNYPQTLESTFDSGRVLSLYHKLLEGFKSEFQPPSGSYHMAPAVEQGLRSIGKTIQSQLSAEPELQKEMTKVIEYLHDGYRHAAQNVEKVGMESWPKQIVHADWHPGNMLYRDNRVVAVIDYDSARLHPRVIDIANGALQFSIVGGDEDVAKWPEYCDESRFKRFLRGYDEVMLLSQAEIRAIPHLMIEALIAEAVFPIAATGQFGRTEGMTFLHMVKRKVHWMRKSVDKLVELAEG